MSEYSDKKLISACRKQNSKAQLWMYQKHSRYLFTVAYRILKDKAQAEDVMQESFIHFFSQSIYQLQKPESYFSFLKKSVLHKSLDLWKKSTNITYLEWGERDILEEEEAQEDHFEGQWGEVLTQLESLPEKYRIMVELFYLQELSHKEISEQLGISYSNSRVLLKRAIEKLKKQCHEKII